MPRKISNEFSVREGEAVSEAAYCEAPIHDPPGGPCVAARLTDLADPVSLLRVSVPRPLCDGAGRRISCAGDDRARS